MHQVAYREQELAGGGDILDVFAGNGSEPLELAPDVPAGGRKRYGGEPFQKVKISQPARPLAHLRLDPVERGAVLFQHLGPLADLLSYEGGRPGRAGDFAAEAVRARVASRAA